MVRMRIFIAFLFFLFPLWEAYGGYWAVLNSGVEVDLQDLHFANLQVGYVVGSSRFAGEPGIILKTTDGGYHWDSQKIPVDQNYHGIDCLGESLCLAVGEHGTILKTADGASWVQLKSGTRANLWDIAMVDEGIAVAVGNVNTILRTIDGGKTWKFVETGEKAFRIPYSGVFFVKGTSVGWIVGAEGTILKTTDAGKTWFRQDAVTALSFWDIFSSDGQIVWVAGGMGDIHKSTDGGLLWVPPSDFQPLPPVSFQGITFTDPFRGYAVGPGGVILKSVNSGESWEQEKSPLPMALNEIQCLNPAVCFTVGEKGTILRYMNTPAGSARPQDRKQ